MYVKICILVKFIQTKNGFPAFDGLLINAIAALEVSSSMVSMRLIVRGPVSSIFCVPSGSAQLWRTPRT